jgi:hypothetical protein
MLIDDIEQTVAAKTELAALKIEFERLKSEHARALKNMRRKEYDLGYQDGYSDGEEQLALRVTAAIKGTP